MHEDPAEDVRIRPALQADANMLERLWTEFMQELSSVDDRFQPSDDAVVRWRNDFKGWLTADGRRIFVAVVEGDLAGFLSVERIYAPPIYKAVPEAIVAELYVAPDYRRRGFARRLLAEARQWCAERGVERLRADVLSRNGNALDFFRGEGADSFAQTLLLELTPSADGSAEPKPKRIGFS